MALHVRTAPSGVVTGRIVSSGTLVIPAGGQLSAYGPTQTREADERIWIYVYPLTVAPNDYIIIGFVAKQAGQLINEWSPVVFDVIGPQVFDRSVDYAVVSIFPVSL